MLLAPQYWSFDNLLWCPPALSSSIKSSLRDACNFRPLAKSLFLALINKIVISAQIKHLLGSGSPSAIFGRIVPVCVNSINGHFRLRLTQIGKKISKIMPTLTKFYASATVIFKSWIVGVLTALLNAKPYSVQSCFGFAMSCICFVKLTSSRARAFTMKTAARLSHARFQMVAAHKFNAATIANALAVFSCRLHQKATKSLARLNRANFFPRHKYSSIVRINNNTNYRGLSNGI